MTRAFPPILLLGAALVWAGCDVEEPTQPVDALQPQHALNATVEDATWTVSIPTEIPNMMYGDGGDYHDAELVRVTVEQNNLSGGWGRDNDFVSHITFGIKNPNDRYIGFENVALGYVNPADYDSVDPDEGYPCCVFPFGECGGSVCNECAYCTCIEAFLNGTTHPHTGYAYFVIEVVATDLDLLTMPLDEPYQLGQPGHEHDFTRMIFRAADDSYHHLEVSKSAHLGTESQHTFNVWITRTSDTGWRVEVGSSDAPLFMFAEEYLLEPINPARTQRRSTLYRGGDFSMAFDLVMDGGSTPSNSPPTADFTYAVTDLTVDFTDQSTDSDGTIESWAWDFGDGATSTAQNPSHTYTADGTYPVSLTVTDDDGATGSSSQDVTVSTSAADITLTATGYKVKGAQYADLSWSGATSTDVDVYRDGSLITTTANDGEYTDSTGQKGGGSAVYQVCEAGTATCSNQVTVTF